MSDNSMSRKTYLSRNIGEYPDMIEVMGTSYEKVDDLRYGTNPHQPAAYYKPAGQVAPIGDMQVLKNGKSGLSQTNLEDISFSLNIVKYFEQQPCCACMKHVNPCGAAVALPGESLRDTYIKARDCDPRAAFGSVVAFNVEVDEETAQEIMGSFVECVVAPAVSDEALAVFNDRETYKLNRHVRVLKCGDLSALPKFVGDQAAHAATFKVLADGSLVVAEPLLTNMRSTDDLVRASGTHKKTGDQESTAPVTDQQLQDLLTAWYVNISVRSNGVVIVKDGVTLSVGTGEQDRVGAVEQAIAKFEQKYEGNGTIDGAVLASDGFFPFPDALEEAAKAGVTAFIAPSGSLNDAIVIKRANELGVSLFHAPERIFSHH